MGKLKKLMGLMLTLLMIISTVKPTFAQGTSSLTVENTGKTPHKFELYQIFKGEVSNGENGKLKLSNIEWGNGVKDTKNISFSGKSTASEIANSLTGDNVEQFAKEISTKLQNKVESELVQPNNSHKFDKLDAGYYLVKDVDASQEAKDKENGAYTLYLLKVVGTVTAKTKLDVPKVEKHVKDINDSEAKEYEDWSKTADHDIGDKVPFKLTGTLPSNFDKYETYKYVFHDEMSKGLTFNQDSVKVYVDKETITSGFAVATTEKGFTVTLDDLKKITGKTITKDSVITVEYMATLNEQAVIGSKGNPNEVYLEYSNNPNKSGDGTGKTPKDKVIVFTYKVIVNKVQPGDRENITKPLSGAEFKLEKWNAVKGQYEDSKVAILNHEKDKFEFKGIDDGKYKLTETKNPPGFNKIQPIEFIVKATHDDKKLELTELNGEKISGEIKFTPNKKEGSLSTDIVNKQGPELPETGGMGTKIIYTVGTVLVLGGVIYLATKRKLSINR
ncbi:MAG: isopeptide-forming domain-containing fimbrial protein [Peptoniphilus sp.]|uniref:isopeptide-forming domain-containing fimbrial protein n=1 Tax=Peptoniphilus sp. TaxID=1971214 RepID=UPI002A764B86|nr:isopeptide-forming domain-containing fimbrial protein [Peptoniphilus sp.]MDY2987706.1 isopeptide-forming domain-containing fimbrial protein [Peptoniphilus sp.]